MKLSLRICGPKCSVCCSLISIWGIIQLIIMGACIYNQNLAFVEDVGLEEEFHKADEMHENFAELSYHKAVNCWIAAGIYVATLAVSLHQVWMNNRPAIPN